MLISLFLAIFTPTTYAAHRSPGNVLFCSATTFSVSENSQFLRSASHTLHGTPDQIFSAPLIIGKIILTTYIFKYHYPENRGKKEWAVALSNCHLLMRQPLFFYKNIGIGVRNLYVIFELYSFIVDVL